MKTAIGIGLLLILLAGLMIVFRSSSPNEITRYTEAELAGVTCAELSKKHEDVITAYHDASIAQFRRTGAFEDGLGVPEEGDLPMIIVLTKAIREDGFEGIDLTKPFFNSASATASKQLSEIYAEFSALCASSPDMGAAAAGRQAAETLGLTRRPPSPD